MTPKSTAASLALVTLGMIFGYAVSARLAGAQESHQLRARQLIIEDENGTSRLTLSAGAGQGANIVVRDQGGTIRFHLKVKDDAGSTTTLWNHRTKRWERLDQPAGTFPPISSLNAGGIGGQGGHDKADDASAEDAEYLQSQISNLNLKTAELWVKTTELVDRVNALSH